jgi:NAD(P)-dependent dehydrogenase (short-subunit alcohol dehydrogenase family)
MTELAEARVVVTGGSSGLGRSVTRALLEAGAHPGVLDLRPPPFEVEHVIVDLADGRAAEQATHSLAARLGGLDAVVTAAGIDACGSLAEVDPAAWERVIMVNLLGSVAVIRAALDHLGRGGRVVTIASTLGLRPVSHATAYCASKFGIVGFTRALAAEVGEQIGVTLLHPGGMRTPFFDGRPEQYRPSPDADLCDPDDVARAVLDVLAQPAGRGVREIVFTSWSEPSWP